MLRLKCTKFDLALDRAGGALQLQRPPRSLARFKGRATSMGREGKRKGMKKERGGERKEGEGGKWREGSVEFHNLFL